MPLYEYECANGHRFEVIQKFSDPPLQACTTCGAAVQKLQASPAFQFKGTGWYITDYAKKDSGGGAGESRAKESSSGEKSEGASQAKTETKSDAKSESATSSKSDSAPAPAKT